MPREKEGKKEVMTAKEVGEYLGFSKNWVYRQVEKGELPGARLGGNWRFKRSIIDEWLEDKLAKKS